MLTREEPARLALEVLAKQHKDLKNRPLVFDAETIAIERRLKHECRMVIEGPTLFGEEQP